MVKMVPILFRVIQIDKGFGMNEIISKILSSTKRALNGETTQNMRALYVTLENFTIKLLFIYNGEITDNDQDNIGYISIDYPKSFMLSKKYVLVYESQENIASNSDKIFVDLDKLKLDKDWCIYKLDE